MNKIAILYGSSGGNTEMVAKQVQDLFEGDADIFNVLEVSIDEIKPYTYFVIGTSTTGVGDLQDDWEGFLPYFSKLDFTGKTVALFALGDSASHKLLSKLLVLSDGEAGGIPCVAVKCVDIRRNTSGEGGLLDSN